MEKNGNAIRLRNNLKLKNAQRIRKKKLDTKTTNYSTFGGSSKIFIHDRLKSKQK